MLKEPRPGRVKSRLGRDIGMTAAAWWFRHQSNGLIRRIRDPRWRTVLAVTPDAAGLTSRVWPGDLDRWVQGRGDLGTRMIRLLRNAGPDPALLIGADIPGVAPAHLSRALRYLGTADIVFGPATDGGFWLVGARHGGAFPRSAFDRVRWSGPHALSDTLSNLGAHRVAFADTLADVDTGSDLRRG